MIMPSTSDSDGEIQRALRTGASGYVLKTCPSRTVAGGDPLGPFRRAPRSVRSGGPPCDTLGEEDLTPRELEVLA